MKRLLLVSFVAIGFFGLAQAQSLDGVWEGEIKDPRRPTVVNVDFSARSISFSGGAPIELKLNDAIAGNPINFEVASGGRTLKFAGSQTDKQIRGEFDMGDRRFPFWLERLPSLTKPGSRAEAWQQDLDVVISRFLRYDRSFSEPQRAAARQRLQALRSKASRMSDQAIKVELGRAVGLSGNAHTRLYLMRNRTELARVPVRLWWFGPELRIVRAGAPHTDLAGCRVSRVGNLSALAAFRKVRGIKPGNESWQRYMSVYFLTSPDLLFGAGVLRKPDRLPMTLICDGRSRHVSLTPLPLRRSSAAVEAWKDLAPSYQSELEARSALAVDATPLYLRHPDRNYWVEYLPGSKVVYVQYSRAQPMSTEPMADFVGRVTRLFEENAGKGLIIDVRFNTGGDLGVGTPLVETLAGKLRGRPVVVITSRATFSAGISHVVQWKQLANAFIVGEPVGDDLDMWSEGGNLLLPNSGLTVHYANGFHTYSKKEYPQFRPYFGDFNVTTIAPDKRVENTWQDYLSGQDRVMEAAIAHINNRR